MKKFLALAILTISAAAFASSVEAKPISAASNLSAPQIRIQLGNRRNNRRRVTTQTRTVRVGRHLFRETYRVVYRANGTTRTQLISRTQIR